MRRSIAPTILEDRDVSIAFPPGGGAREILILREVVTVLSRMRRRRGFLRSMALLCMAVLAIGLGTDAYAHQECAHHDLSASLSHDHDGSHSDGHGGHHSGGGDAEKSGGTCSCLGECCIAVVSAAPESDAPRLAMFASVAAAFDRLPALEPALRRVPFLIPFSTAPPRSIS